MAGEMCDAAMSFGDYMTDFEFIKAFSCTYFSTAGMLATGLLTYGAISASIYVRTGSVLIPFVLLLLTGGAVMSQLASVGMTIATLVLLITGAGTITLLYRRYA